jgi:hypothetical protein
MPAQRPGWEGTLLLFIITFTVLMGISYNLGYIYRFPIPWLLIIVLAAGVALAVRYLRRPKS